MGDEYHRALVRVEGAGDDRQVAEIDVIGRLVEDEKAGLHQHQAGEGDESLLPFRQMPYSRPDQVSRDEETRRDVPHIPFNFPVHHRGELFIHRRAEIEIGKILPIVADPHAFRNGRAGGLPACLRRQARERFEKRGFAYPVGPLEKQVLIFTERKRFFLDDGFVNRRRMQGVAGFPNSSARKRASCARALHSLYVVRNSESS